MDYVNYITLGAVIVSWIVLSEGVIVSRGYQRSIVSRTLLSCTSVTNPLPSPLATSDLYYCSILCSKETCSSFCIVDRDCLFLELMMSPGELTAAVNSETVLCYVPINTTGTTKKDLLRGKAVRPQESWGGTYAAVETVVTGARCEKSAADCFCSIDSLWPSVVVNMGTSQSVAEVVVTMSSFYPDYFANAEVRVGSSGTRNDPLLTTYSGTPTYGERLTLKGSQSLVGMYVSIFRDVPLADSLCLCLMEAYGG